VFVLDADKFNPRLDEREELSLNKFEKQHLLVNYDSGLTVAVSSIFSTKAQMYLVLKETGSLQIWNSKSGQIMNRLHFNEQCSSMAAHSKFPLVAVGTQSGRLIFIDLSDENTPKIIENCRVHKRAIKLLKYC